MRICMVDKVRPALAMPMPKRRPLLEEILTFAIRPRIDANNGAMIGIKNSKLKTRLATENPHISLALLSSINLFFLLKNILINNINPKIKAEKSVAGAPKTMYKSGQTIIANINISPIFSAFFIWFSHLTPSAIPKTKKRAGQRILHIFSNLAKSASNVTFEPTRSKSNNPRWM